MFYKFIEILNIFWNWIVLHNLDFPIVFGILCIGAIIATYCTNYEYTFKN